MTGKLYVVAVPIGNSDDITLRALRVLADVDLIATEDTRDARRFLACHNIINTLTSYHEHNETQKVPGLIKKLKQGSSVALVSKAGTPLISDPGYRLVKAAVDENIPVVPVPGVSAITAALSSSGLPTDAFVFEGFLPRTKGKRSRNLKLLAAEPKTVILYESPQRICKLLREIRDIMGDRYAVIGREMTKRYEEFLRGSISDQIDELERRRTLKGEFTVLIAGLGDQPEISSDRVQKDIKTALTENRDSLSNLVKKIAKKHGVSKQTVYKEAIRLKGDAE
ncbi:MAG: 16S rRNA (cytidine(1402)-2'-O)-methyltransferase [Deltaproteobacteria bacterium]|nr:16S rRNA (cytidine(1402)-2'-O)-methyltransferase [Deltaproteobacteria bacterium]